MKESANLLDTGDTTIYFELSGASSGIPLFVLHGGPGFDHTYLEVSHVWTDLGETRPVVLYDQRGTGQSSVQEEGDTCTLADQLADLESLQEHLGFDRVDILGHSWGGFLGMAYAARHPARIRRLILVNSEAPLLRDTVSLFEYTFPETVEQQKSVASAAELGDEGAAQESIEAYLSMLCYSQEKKDQWMAQMDPTIYRHNVYQSLSTDAKRFDLNPELAKLTMPTLVITGRYDISIAPSVAFAIHKSLSDSQFVVFEESGHLPFFEEPEAFVREINKFLPGS